MRLWRRILGTVGRHDGLENFYDLFISFDARDALLDQGRTASCA
jgi:hypothetical protein